MPGKVKVKIISGRNLPVMDRSSDTTDAYVEIKLGNTTYKTDVCRKTLHPHWNSEWYRFEVDDSELQDEPLQIRLMDHDTYSANDAIGKVYLDLNPLLLPSANVLLKYGWNGETSSNIENSTSSVMSGWIPVYDTMHGIRGEVNITVKVELFSDFNKFRQSSCGVQFFCSSTVPHGYYAQVVHGFVEELIVNDDPEYQWIDKIRTPRASNEARQTLFFKLSGELQRKIGVKALDLGANSVIGYNHCFDLEGESGIVARGIGTAVTLVKLVDIPQQVTVDTGYEERVLSYLSFLGSEKTFCLNSEPDIFNNFSLASHTQPINLQTAYFSKIPDIEVPIKSKQLIRHLSHTDFTPHTTNIHHSASLQTLLKQEDMRGTPAYGISQKIRNLKYSSQNILSKKMIALKAKLTDTGMPEEIDSQETKSASVIELNEFKKKKPFKFPRTVSNDSSVMAEVLIRSVIKAHNSLNCILEVHTQQENDDNTSKSDTLNKLQPLENLLNKTASDISSSSDSSSSDDEENLSESRDSNVEYDTVSNIVKNVEIIERKLSLKNRKNCEQLNDNLEKTIFSNNDNIDNKTDDLKSLSDDDYDDDIQASDNFCDDSKLNLEYDSNLNDEIELVVPSLLKDNVCNESLIHTAMQTMLLEKINIMRNYTPPVSPGFKTNEYFDLQTKFSSSSTPEFEKDDLFLSNQTDESFLPQITRTFESMRKCKSTLSLEDVNSEKNALLNKQISISTDNIKFEILNQDCIIDKIEPIKKTSSYEQAVEKENIIVKSKSEDFLEIENSQNLINSKSDPLEINIENHDKNEKLERSSSYNYIKRKFNIFCKKKPNKQNIDKTKISKSNDDINKNKKSRILNIFHRRVKSSNSDTEKHEEGLLGAALGNVVMETVQDILATSHTNKSKENTKIHTFPQSSILTANVEADLNPQIPVAHINMEIDDSLNSSNKLHASLTPSLRNSGSPIQETQKDYGHQRAESVGAKMANSPAKLNAVPCIHRRSSDSDLSITPKGNSLTGSDRSGGVPSSHLRGNTVFRPTLQQDNFDMLEYPFLTMTKFPPGFITYLGGAVSARSVKLLERISNLEEPESRDTWWSEIRLEIRSHARALNCNAVLGYTENTSICEDVCVLSASGTAAIIGFNYTGETNDNIGGLPVIAKPQNVGKEATATVSQERNEFENTPQKTVDNNSSNVNMQLPESPENDGVQSFLSNNLSCSMCHLPYNGKAVPLRITTSKCVKCRLGKVPDVLIATIEMPEGLPSVGRGCFIQSYVCRPLKDAKSESNAKEISDGLPFLEYELHRLLVNKLKIKAMNAIFGLKVKITIGEKLLVGVATGTAVFLSPLPAPQLPKLVSDRSVDEKTLAPLQKHLNETIKKNIEIYQIKYNNDDFQNGRMLSDDESEDEQPALDLSKGNKDCCILEVDDPEDVEVLNLLLEARPPDGFHVVNTELVPGLVDLEIVKNLQMFTQVWRVKVQPPYNLDKHFHRLLQTVYFKLRRMIPCALCDLQFRVDLPEPDEVQLCVVGMALGLGDPQKQQMKFKRKCQSVRRNDDDLIFNLEDDQIPENSVASSLPTANQLHAQTLKYRQKSPQRNRFIATKQRHVPHRERHGVDITPLSYVPGGKIERYLGNLNFFFIRETTSIREEGGLSGFIHSFMTEVLAIVRAHVMALGGNAMVAYFMTECVLNHNLHKNQGQCLINVGGDVVFVSYFNEES